MEKLLLPEKSELLELDGISQYYGRDRRRFNALRDIDLRLYEGEFTALLGPSGCGKSTLLRIITGLQKPTAGHVLYRNEPLRGVNPAATIVFQTFALFPWLNIRANVELALKARGVERAERTRRAEELLQRVGLEGFENAYPRELSGGMRQKVGFARAMAVEPELLCLDEPFSALDVLSARALRGELLELWTGGGIPTKAVLMVTHNIEEAVFMADRIIVMEKDPGRITAEIRVELPHPRDMKGESFLNLVDRVYATMAGQTQPEHIEFGTAPGEPGRTRGLPHITINDLAGFMERLGEIPGNRTDIYQLGRELKGDSDHLLRLTEAAELLGFATIAKGDITLTALGETFAEASIASRKEIFAMRIRRLPLFQWLLSLLHSSEESSMEWNVVQRALELEFPPEEAYRQLDTAVNWGRYAMEISYDDATEILTLEGKGAVAR